VTSAVRSANRPPSYCKAKIRGRGSGCDRVFGPFGAASVATNRRVCTHGSSRFSALVCRSPTVPEHRSMRGGVKSMRLLPRCWPLRPSSVLPMPATKSRRRGRGCVFARLSPRQGRAVARADWLASFLRAMRSPLSLNSADVAFRGQQVYRR
jgi:hypothetical protein